MLRNVENNGIDFLYEGPVSKVHKIKLVKFQGDVQKKWRYEL